MRNKPRKFETNTVYNNIQVFGRADRPYRCYNAKCLLCGHEFIADAKTILNMAERGSCGKCSKEEKTKKYIGAIFDNLEVIGLGDENNNETVVKCRCRKCGSVTSIRLRRLRQGVVKQCKYCGQQNLKKGRTLVDMASKEGTNVFSLGNKINKNNTTGVKGVSYMHKYNKYRAYINFKRKQYYLGMYSSIEDAEEARKKAEEKIYGEFLEWYAETYPEEWKKIKKTKKRGQSNE